MGSKEQTALATRLRLLHHADTPLILPNAWDAASARAVQEAGFPAVATTSGGVAASLGWPDGEQVPADEMFAAIARIVRSVDVPVTADIEAGYGLSAVELVDRLIGSGAVGCNIEDTDHVHGRTLVSTEIQAQRLASVKEAAVAAGVDVVVNARVDVFLRQGGNDNEAVEEAVGRAERYAEAGADCVYPIGANEAQLAVFIGRFRGVVNGMVRPGVVRLSRLRGLGVARISFG
ncbi:MAG: isocitrate lyase/PEP mutase family protein, partial [Acidimicrobiales bacterium]